ncbi:MAG: hypothetical protein RLZZ130_1791 [Pseudomonadota bacterium]|jgi:hypothetical protein|uniref:hypothetical protein n=1 Tax=Sphingorhabdus sp. TaxID=1902408 RepID=UPI0034F9F5B2
MHLGEAQRDMRRAYVNGGVGIFASGLVWTLSGLVTMNINPRARKTIGYSASISA